MAKYISRLLLASPFSIFQRASPKGAKILSFGSSIRMLRSARYRILGRRYSPVLFQPVARRFVSSLRLDDGDRKVAGVAEKIIGPLLAPAMGQTPCNDNPTISEGLLLREGVRIVIPARVYQLGEDVFPAGIGFGHSEAQSHKWGRSLPYSRPTPSASATRLMELNQAAIRVICKIAVSSKPTARRVSISSRHMDTGFLVSFST